MLKHDRSTSFAKANFWIGTEHLILFGRQVFTDVKYRSATPDTFRDSAKTFSDIAIYASVSNCVFGQ